jgi:hypothetical protein
MRRGVDIPHLAVVVSAIEGMELAAKVPGTIDCSGIYD